MMRPLFVIALAIAGCASSPATALTFPDRGRAGVVDAAHVLPTADREALNAKVVGWDNATGHQLVVATVPSLQGADIKDYGYQLGRAWGLGDKKSNDGAILLLAMAEHKVRIEVGYGLEPVLTDAATSVILHDRVVPRLKEGDFAAALSDGADAIMTTATPPVASLRSAPAVAAKHPAKSRWSMLLPIAGLLLGLLAWILIWAERDRRARLAKVERRGEEDRARREALARRVEAARPSRPPQRLIRYPERPRDPSAPLLRPERSTSRRSTAPAVAIITTPTPSYTPPSRSSSFSSDNASGSSDSSWGGFGSNDTSSSSSSSDSSSGGFDSGGGSFGGGGSDSSW